MRRAGEVRLRHWRLPRVRKELDAGYGFGFSPRFRCGFSANDVAPAARVDQEGSVAVIQPDPRARKQRRHSAHIETRPRPINLDDEEPRLIRYAGSSLRLNANPE